MWTAEHPNLATAFVDSCARHADDWAVIDGERRTSYAELDQLTAAVGGGIAAALAAAPAGQVPVVAVVLPASIEFIAAVMGTIRAGAAYLPIDSQHPDDYITDLLAQARPALVITTSENVAGYTSPDRPAVAFDDLRTPFDGDLPGLSVAPTAPAYVIYTSGSTGRPKGVVVSHDAMINSTDARDRAYGVPRRMPLIHSVAFDLSSGVVFWALLSGGTLIINPVPLTDVPGTLEMIYREDVTHLVYPASLYSTFLEYARTRPPLGIEHVMIGSERWSELLIGRHAEILPTTSLHNEYGPTEACVWTSAGCVYNGRTSAVETMTIGRPIAGAEYHLADSPDDLFPADEPGHGELYISGRNVAIGYLHQPRLTEQRFVKLPDGRRAYRTGDLVERLPDGRYRFVGRADRQIKVQGNRIEPGHVETALMTHPAVEQAHVTAVQRGDSGSGLVAYAVLRPSAADTSAENLRAHVAQSLPAYLVPHAFVIVASLPRNPSGKIDESRLPAPVTGTPPVDDSTGAADPRLAAIFAEVLGLEHAPADLVSLAELGITSLGLVRAAAMIRQVFDVEVPVSELFALPDMAAVAERVRAGGTNDRPPLVPLARHSSDAPLSAQQHQIWFLNHLSPEALAYNTQFSLLLTGDIDVLVLNAALTHIVQRHEILRTTFHEGADGPHQTVHSGWQVAVDVVDLRGVEDSAAAVHRDMTSLMTTPFVVSELPLVRWRLYRLGDSSWNLFQVEHHFVHDGWSASLFLREIRDTYRAIAAGDTPGAAELRVQYRDYARWYHRWRETADYRQQKEYWLGKLAGCPQVGVTFDTDRPRPAAQSFAGDRVQIEVPTGLLTRVDELCQARGVTRFAVFLSAFAAQVWHHTGETDMVIGSALSNRRQAETAGLLGMFVNALPLRLTVDPTAPVSSTVRATMTTLLEAQDHQEFPLIDLIKELDLPRDRARNPLFGLMFAFHDSPRPRFELDGLSGRLRIDHNGSAKNDVNVVCVPNPPEPGSTLSHAGISVLWEYNTDLFDHATAQRHAEGFVRIVELVVSQWDTELGAADLHGPAGLHDILAAGEGPSSESPFGTLHEGVDRQIAAAPDSVAIRHDGRSCTYGELDVLARAVEEVLRFGGVAAGDVVAVASDKTPDLVAAWLATARLGAAYVCLDLGQPAERLAGLLADAAVSAVLCPPENTFTFDGIGVPTIPLKAGSDPGPRQRRATAVAPTSPAYLTYTSGSTGAPKAVVTSHRNAVTAIHARTEYFGEAPPRTLVTLPIIFDVAGSMVWWTLWRGGVVVFPDPGADVRDVDQIRSLAEREHVTHVNFVASFYRHFAEAVPVGSLSGLRVVAIGGEPCTPDLVALHAQRLPSASLHNEYGPTEATVWCSATCVHAPGQPPTPVVTIGRPLANYTMVVLTDADRPAPVGARGELWIGGDGVALGYHDRPDLTAKSFVTFSTGPLAGRRFYRTGDYARLTSEGEFELFGRIDGQVKVRGYRIETGEIERCLAEHPLVGAAYVGVAEHNGSHVLAAYVAASGQDAELAGELRDWVAAKLPAYMVPASIAVLDRLPLTGTGKIDRDRLPRPSAVLALDAGTGTAAETPEQELLLSVWRTLLGRSDIGIDDDFFAVGGDSLQSIRAVAQARARGLTITVAQLLSTRTIRALSAHVRPITRATGTVEHRPGGTRLRLTPIQGWFFAQEFNEPDCFAQVRVFDLPSDADVAMVRQAVEWTLARHEAFRTRFVQSGGAWHAVLIDAPDPVGWDQVDTSGNVGDAVRAALDTINVETGPLWRVVLIEDAAAPTRSLGLVLHHLIVDAVSWDVIAQDIAHAHARLRSGATLEDRRAPGVPDAPAPTPELGEAAHWYELAEEVRSGELTPPRTGSLTLADRTATRRTLPAHVRRFLLHDAPLVHRVAARALLLGALARAMDPGTGVLYAFLEGHGRDRLPDADEIVGWFTSLYPVLLRTTDASSLIHAAAVVDRAIAAVPSGGVGYGQARYLDPGSDLGRLLAELPAPQVTFNFLGQHQPLTDLLRPAPVPLGTGIGGSNVLPTAFDMTVSDTGSGMSVDVSYDSEVFPEDLVDVVLDRMTADLEDAAGLVELTPRRADHAEPHLFIHAVDGTITRYEELSRRVQAQWRCLGLPQMSTPAVSTVRDTAITHLTRLRRRGITGPVALTGWSFGAAVAFELAQLLEVEGIELTRLTLVDPPLVFDRSGYEADLRSWLTQLVASAPDGVVADVVDSTAGLPARDRLAEIRVRLLKHTPQAEQALVTDQLELLLGNYEALRRWRPDGTVASMNIVLSTATSDSGKHETHLWAPHSRGVVGVDTVPGDHFSMLTGPGVVALADLLLARVDGEG
ncbi:amino acid adenylation domain-containing protein [Lentzea sp. NEAU-D13]|uniref:Amino acid adenylation domain-containing protein n=1 Tax=Lentzea alba TaxID=2714351 RepID=A0A7C9RUC1_9PSEU|nr:non-ribosomal peptide synthetase [Lentzea alba]NGY63130.1 amino acid adenylation domain-containing protein [Lentzea alba]